MNEFLTKIKLIDYLSVTLPVSRQQFNKKLSEITEQGSTNTFFTFEAFSRSAKEFKGQVRYDGFKLRRRQKMFDRNQNMAIASGRYKEGIDQLTIDIEIVPLKGFLYVFYGFLAVFYVIFLTGFLLADTRPPLFVFPFIAIHGCVMILIPYFITKRSVKRMKYELERELYYLTKSE